jgi:hypothetical protein
MIKLLAIVLVVLSLSGCAHSGAKTLTIYNASADAIALKSVQGIRLFEKGSGPQDYGGKVYPPNHLGRFTTWQTLYVDLPIEVKWSNADAGVVQTSEVGAVAGLLKNPLKGEGNILLVFETSKVWTATFMTGDVAPAIQTLEKMYR